MFGILNINKPSGCSSRDVVTRVVRELRKSTGNKIKAGHAGTLDPQASGVLIVCLGKATRLIPYIQRSVKTYVGRFQLDLTSASADLETETEPISPPVVPGRPEIEKAIPAFVGNIQQKPPAYSAISIDGQRAYRLARKGIDFEIKAKTVWIKKLEIKSFVYPFLELLIECGSGTYIRSLGRDLARSLGSDAVMTELTRTSIGNFLVEDALDYENIDSNLGETLINPLKALEGIEQVQLDGTQLELLSNGRFISPQDIVPLGNLNTEDDLPSELVAIDENGKLVAVLEPRDSLLKSKINFV